MYVQVVSRGEVSFEVDLSFMDCGDVGLYGHRQRDWSVFKANVHTVMLNMRPFYRLYYNITLKRLFLQFW